MLSYKSRADLEKHLKDWVNIAEFPTGFIMTDTIFEFIMNTISGMVEVDCNVSDVRGQIDRSVMEQAKHPKLETEPKKTRQKKSKKVGMGFNNETTNGKTNDKSN